MKPIVISIIATAILIGGAIMFSGSGAGFAVATPSVDNESIANGKQIVEIGVKGGYSPKLTAAKANMPTVLRMKTNATFDCTSFLNIPSIGYRNSLPPSGETDIEIPAQQSGTTLKGLCAMGMYHFAINFN